MSEQMDYRYGQGVWRHKEGNGVIVAVLFADKEVVVEWYNSKTRDIISYDELMGNWDWKLKQWILTQ